MEKLRKLRATSIEESFTVYQALTVFRDGKVIRDITRKKGG